MEIRTNGNFIIVNAITIGNVEIVLAKHKTLANRYITWECKDKYDFFWGHSFTTLQSAQKDFFKRGLKKMRAVKRGRFIQKLFRKERKRYEQKKYR